MNLSRPKVVDSGIVLAACVVLVLFRLHAFQLPLETDEANYAYIGERLLDGNHLYVDVWDHQPPGVFMLFAGAIAVFGDSLLVFRWLATAFSIASLALIFAILRRISGRPAAILGAVLYCVVSSDPGTGGEGANREIYMNTLILAAWWLALRGWANVCEIAPLIPKDQSPQHSFSGPCSPDQRYLCTFAAGLALGIASLFKTNAAVYWAFLAAWIAVQAWIFDPTKRMKSMFAAIAGFALGPILVWVATFGFFAGTNRLKEFTEAVFLVNLDYARADGSYFSRFWTFFDPPRFEHIFDSAFPLWIGAAAALAWLLTTAIVRPGVAFAQVASLVLAGYVAVCLPGRFWPHYYYLLIPPAVIALSLFMVALLHASAELLSRRKRTATVAIVASGLIVAALLFSEYKHYISKNGIEITINRYNTRDFWGRAHGENVAKVTSPGDTIFVYGNDAAIYYYSHRKCASRYTMITGLHPGMRGASERRQILMSELRKSPPRLILVVFDQEPFDEWKDFLREYYGVPVGWDFRDQTDKPIMFVLARKDAPIEHIDWNWDRSHVARKEEPVVQD
jgi:4-amino-4-deoxy-L-arabinose transferase-like glycosyltransferase